MPLKPIVEKIASMDRSVFLLKRIRHPFFDAPFHYHPEVELTYVSSSCGRRVVGDHVGSFEKGDLVLHGPNLPHVYVNDSGDSRSKSWARASVLQFGVDCLGQKFDQMEETKGIADLIERSMRGIRFLEESARRGARMLEELSGRKGPRRIVVFIELLDFLSNCEEIEYLAGVAYSPLLNLSREGRLNEVLSYIYKHQSEELRLTEIAKFFGISPESFSRFFKKATGRSFIVFLNELRISQACWLLQQSDKTVVEICFAVGFSNLSNFNRRFRKIKGMTPLDYRKKSRFHPVPGA